MNLLEHYIKEVHSIDDVSNKFEEKNGYPPDEPLLRIILTYDCYGRIHTTTCYFPKSKWEETKKQGYFMA